MSHSGEERDTAAGEVPIQGFEEVETDTAAADWEPVADRLIRVGIAGQGVCSFGGAFHFQDHPNVEIGGACRLRLASRMPKRSMRPLSRRGAST